MRLLRRASRRWLTRHPAQLALSVLGVALGVAVVVGIDLAIQSARAGFRVSAETVGGRATHQVIAGVGGLPDSLLRVVRVDLGIAASAPVVEVVATSPDLPGRALRVLGVDPFSEGPFRPFLAGGPAGLDVGTLITVPRAAVLSARTAAEAGLVVGDSLRLSVDGREVPVPVAGLLTPGDRLAEEGLRELVVMDVSGAQSLRGRAGLDRIDLRLDPDREAALLDAVRRVVPGDARVEEAGTRTDTLAGMIAAFDLNLRALSLLALVFGLFLIYNAQTFSVVQRRELLGSLRALGVTRRQVLATVLLEAAWIGAAGAALGVVLGAFLGRGLVDMVTRTIQDLWFVLSVRELQLPPAVLLRGAALGLGGTLLATVPAAWEAVSAPPRVARVRSLLEARVRRDVPRAGVLGGLLAAAGAGLLAVPSRSVGWSFAGLFLAILGMALLTPLGTLVLVAALRRPLARVGGILGAMAAREVSRGLSRTAPAVAALVVAVSVTVGLGVMIQSFRGTLVRWLDGTLQADVYVSLPSVQASRAEGTLPPGLVRAFRGHPGVAGSSTYRGVSLPLEDGPLRLVALDLDPRGETSFDLLDGDREAAFRAFRAGTGALVSEPFAYRRGLGAGDTLRLPTPAGPAELRVAGVFYDYGSDRGTVMIDRRAYDRWWDDPGVTSLSLFVAPDVEPSALVRELEARVPDGLAVSVRTNRALREGSLAVFDRTFRVTAVLRLLALLVAFVGVLSALMALELERGRELGLLRAMGLTPGQLRALVGAQTGLLGLAAGVLAVPVGLALAVVMVFVVNRRSFGWTLRMEVGPEVVVQALALALAGALVAGVYPAWRMGRNAPAVALRGE